MDITNMIYFVTVCQYRNITKAAEVLHISQSSLSRRIMSLESELGLELLERSGGNIEITPAGRLFNEEARAIIKRNNQAMKKLQLFKNKDAVRIGFSSSLYLRPFVDMLCDAGKRCDTELYFVENSIMKIANEFRDGNLDIAYLTRGEIDGTPGVSFKTIVENNLSILVPKMHRLWNKTSISMEDLEGERICIPNEGGHEAMSAIKMMGQIKNYGFDLDKFEEVKFTGSGCELMMYVCTCGYLALSGYYASDGRQLFIDKFKSVRLELPSPINYGDMVVAYRDDNERIKDFIDILL